MKDMLVSTDVIILVDSKETFKANIHFEIVSRHFQRIFKELFSVNYSP